MAGWHEDIYPGKAIDHRFTGIFDGDRRRSKGHRQARATKTPPRYRNTPSISVKSLTFNVMGVSL